MSRIRRSFDLPAANPAIRHSQARPSRPSARLPHHGNFPYVARISSPRRRDAPRSRPAPCTPPDLQGPAYNSATRQPHLEVRHG